MNPISRDTALRILNALDPIALFDKEGCYLYVNDAWRRNSKVSQSVEQLSAMHPWQLIPDSRVKEVLETRHPVMDEVITVRGTKAFVSYLPMFDDGGVFDGVLMWQSFDSEKSELVLQNASAMIRALRRELVSTQSSLSKLESERAMGEIVGESPAIRNLKRDILSAARTSSTVLIEGETGTGKELVARAIHRLGRKTSGRFVPVNCSAIPENLMESEFFGYEDGAFTGAKRGGRPGKFELAQNGTLFLDEIHQLSLFMQPKFLRVLQEREVERLSGSRTIPINFRCIAATNVDLLGRVASGSFREDLYYRLNVIHIQIPPLRERREDIPLLVESMLAALNARLETNIIMADRSAMDLLLNYHWPGNVRELQNVLESAMNRAWDGILTAEHLRLPLTSAPPAHASGGFFRVRRALESESIVRALEEAGHNKSKAARLLGISRSALYKKMDLYGLK